MPGAAARARGQRVRPILNLHPELQLNLTPPQVSRKTKLNDKFQRFESSYFARWLLCPALGRDSRRLTHMALQRLKKSSSIKWPLPLALAGTIAKAMRSTGRNKKKRESRGSQREKRESSGNWKNERSSRSRRKNGRRKRRNGRG